LLSFLRYYDVIANNDNNNNKQTKQSIKEVDLSTLHGRKIAIDASMAIYQFLIAVRSGGPNQQSMVLTNAAGETTSHVQGLWNRTIKLVSTGIQPIYVFDGKAPTLKSGELQKRRDKREKAEAAMKVATENENVDEMDKQSKRLVRAGRKENEDRMKLLRLMGIPVIQAPCEAEAQASALAKSGKVYATATEDMDALTFGTPVLLRKMTFSSGTLIQTVDYAKAVAGLGLSHAAFVDLCIMLGCDYCDSIKGVGPKTALKLIREHGNIETILQHIDRKKFTVPNDWIPNEKPPLLSAESDNEEEDDDDDDNKEAEREPLVPIYVQARKLFLEHPVELDDLDLKAKPCQADALLTYLVDEMGFNKDRVVSNIEKLQKASAKNNKPQMRMDSFFKAKPQDPAKTAQMVAKRKAVNVSSSAAAKKKTKPTTNGKKKK
jgi:flap endonuclease-1